MIKWELYKLKSAFIGAILLIQCTSLWGNPPEAPSIEEKLSKEVFIHYPEKNPRIEIRIVLGLGLEKESPTLSALTLQSLKIVEEALGLEFKDDFSLVFDNRPDFHNGLTTVVPTNRVYVHTEVPNLESSIGLVKHPLYETTIHELAHLIILQQRRGVFRPLSWVFGTLSRPLSVFPRWMHEGIAVWTESQVGGRGQFGMIQADIRKYSDYYQRNKKHPLSSDLLDGSLELQRVEAGTVPYHFGYLLVDDLLKKATPQKRGETFEDASRKLGFFFSSTFRDNDKVLGDRFKSLRDEWAHYLPLDETKIAEMDSSENIGGPFLSQEGISWISRSKKTKKLVLNFFSKPQKSKDNSLEIAQGMTLLQAYKTQEGWVLLAYEAKINTNQPARKHLYRLSNEGKLLCHNSSIDRLREITVDNTLGSQDIAWIRSDQEGFFHFEKATFNTHCEIRNIQSLHKAEQRHQRLSHPWLRSSDWLLSESDGLDLSHDYIIGPQQFKLQSPEGALGNPQKIKSSTCNNCIVANLYSPNYRGPVFIKKNSIETLTKFPIRTEAHSSTFWDEKIYTREVLWEKDRLRDFSINTPPSAQLEKTKRSLSTENNSSKTSQIHIAPSEQGKDLENYGAWPSIWPHFWFPNFQSYDRGYNISGSTFFADLSNQWQGSLAAGFDTGAQRPFGTAILTRNSLGTGMLDQWNLEAASYFKFIGKTVQDNVITSTSFRISQTLSSRFQFAVLPGAELRHGSRAANLRPYSVLAPTLGFLFMSPHAVNVRLGAYQITNFNDAFYFYGKAHWLPETAVEVNSNFQGKLGRTGYLLGVEYAKASPKSFPKMFYEWGGRPSFSTLDVGYLARGYATSIGPALQLLRGNFEFGFKVWDTQSGLPWNRAHIKSIELRPLYEVITSDLYFSDANGKAVASSVRMGKRYFQTAGAELDVFFQALHYLDFKASIGVFRGLDKGGETQVGLKLVSLLDFL